MLSRSLPFLLLLGTTLPLSAKGIYSRSATSIGLRCDAMQKCPVVSVLAPDGRSMVRRIFRREKVNYLGQYLDVNIPSLELVTPQGRLDLNEWMIDIDVLWSPDSRFVALTGGTSSYTESLRVFAITESGPKPIDATLQPARDMALLLQPYCARYIGPLDCIPDPGEDGLNFVAVAWADTHTLALVSEVPCGTAFGGTMCQAMGYEVDPPSGNIVSKMTFLEFSKKWRHAIPPRFRIPEPPEWQN